MKHFDIKLNDVIINSKDIHQFLVKGKKSDAILYVKEKTNCTDEQAIEVVEEIYSVMKNNQQNTVSLWKTTKKEIKKDVINCSSIPSPTPVQSNQPHCPYCNSTNLTKVSGTSRFASTLMFGIGSKKIGKQWKCNNCKSYF